MAKAVKLKSSLEGKVFLLTEREDLEKDFTGHALRLDANLLKPAICKRETSTGVMKNLRG